MNYREIFMEVLEARAVSVGLTPRELREATGPLVPTEALTAALEHKEGALLLLGPPGTGKTLAGTRWLLSPLLVLNNWEWEGGRWFTPRPLTLVWRTAKSLSRVKQYEPRELEVLFDAKRLVLDDLGQEYLDKAGFLASLVDELVTERHRRGRMTVMTANLNAEEFEERYGQRVLDRVAGEGRVLVCKGESLRGARVKPTISHACGGKDVHARLKECEERQTREALERHAAWLESERVHQAERAAAPPPPPPPMTPEETAARKAEIARQLEDWTARENRKS